MKKLFYRIALFNILIIFWILWNNSLKPEVLYSGIFLVLIAILIVNNTLNVFRGIKFTPISILYSLLYILLFIYEMIKSNIDVMLRVLNPKLPINPGIVRIETSIKSPLGRLILANTITLTPGTFVIEMKDQYIYVHWIDICCNAKDAANQQAITEQIAGKFERILKKIYE